MIRKALKILEDVEELILCSFRYYLGRRTIGSCHFAQRLSLAWPYLPENLKNLIKKDLEREFEKDDEIRKISSNFRKKMNMSLPLGDDCDKEYWRLVRKAYQNEEATKSKNS